jgi:signal recognition particle receptor subunit beta
MITIDTYGERTLFFDFFSIDIGKIKDYQVRIQLYSGPGQFRYSTISRLVLKGVDGIVFVADSTVRRREKNIASMKKLMENLALHNRSIKDIPMVLQYNKRDLEEIGIPLLTCEEMDKDLNTDLKTEAVEASALLGINVLGTMKKIVSLTVRSIQDNIPSRYPEHPRYAYSN